MESWIRPRPQRLSYTQDDPTDADVEDLASQPTRRLRRAAATVDMASPAVVARDTVDLDGDGFIDALHVTFNESVSDATVDGRATSPSCLQAVTGEAFNSTTERR